MAYKRDLSKPLAASINPGDPPRVTGRTTSRKGGTKTVVKNKKNKQVVKSKTVKEKEKAIYAYKRNRKGKYEEDKTKVLRKATPQSQVVKSKTVKKKNPVTGKISKSTKTSTRKISDNAASRKYRRSDKKASSGTNFNKTR